MNAISIHAVTVLLQCLLLGAIVWKLPDWRRPELYFAITVPADFPGSPRGRAILARYRRAAWMATGVALALVLALLVTLEGGLGALSSLAILPQMAIAIWAYLRARSEVKEHGVAPTTKREAGLDSWSTRRIPMGGFLGPIIILALAAVGLAMQYDALPDPIPTHFDLEGRPDAWSEKSVASVFGPLLIAASLCLTMPLLGFVILRGTSRPHGGGAAAKADWARKSAVMRMLVLVNYLMVLIFVPIAYFPLIRDPDASRWMLIAILVVAQVGSLALLVWSLARLAPLFDASNRAAEAAPAGEAPIGDRLDDRHWKWGMIYYNPDDPALFVEKRIGMGYTNNFARPASWLILLAMIALPLLVVLAVTIWS